MGKLSVILILILIPFATNAKVIVACTFETIPQVILTYPDGEGGVSTMQVASRPPVDMTVGEGASRNEIAVIDGYRFQFHPANLTLDVQFEKNSILNEVGRCATIGLPLSDKPLNLVSVQNVGDTAAEENLQESKSKPTVEQEAVDTGKWLLLQDISQLDDTKTVSLHLASDNTISGQFGSPGTASIYLRCLENTTSVFLIMNDMFLSDIQGFGTVDFRIDDKKADKLRMLSSTDNKALGLWSGGSAIPFAKRLIAGSKVVFRVTPFNQSPVEVTFDLKGLDEAIKPLQQACNW